MTRSSYKIIPTKKLERSIILHSDTYRDFKSSYVLAAHENCILLKDDLGNFKLPNEVVEARN